MSRFYEWDKILGVLPHKNFFSVSEWSGFLRYFGAKMRVTMENNSIENIPEVKKNWFVEYARLNELFVSKL